MQLTDEQEMAWLGLQDCARSLRLVDEVGHKTVERLALARNGE